MRNCRFSSALVASALLPLFFAQADMALAVDIEKQDQQIELVSEPGLQIASAPEIAGRRVPVASPEPGREPTAAASPGPENVAVSTSAQRLKENEARAMLAALMALASSGGGRPFPLLPH
jgi:hypothetical protein